MRLTITVWGLEVGVRGSVLLGGWFYKGYPEGLRQKGEITLL